MVLTVENLVKRYPGSDRPVLRGLSLSVGAGETVALTGESGSGKSTALHLIAGLDHLDGGEITLGGTPLSGLSDAARADLRRNRVALIFQQFNLIPSLTVDQNLSFHARLAGRDDPQWRAEIAGRLGLADLGARYPEALSGGQAQRVAIGRALALRPPLLLADEPTGNLDETTAGAVLDLMLDLVRDTGAALLLVTHSDKVAARLDRHLHLSGGVVA
ncbi:MAG: ABC transporter ATP-binding protein [Marinibacterium sp.]|nr:ABC transporter ATP-binding protein [Marinibacterium sp.]